MKRLAPNLFDRRYDELVEAARSRLPSLAPRWTDYNAHDPGITLMELLAWVAEAQMYSLGRMRRDERTAYAALLGLKRTGTEPARGMLWPDRSDPDSPFRTFHQSVVIEPDASVRTPEGETPEFHPTHRILWAPGRIVSLQVRLANRRVIDHTRGNESGRRAFEPFGPDAGPRDLLRLELETNGQRGLFPIRRDLAAGALWSLGVRVDAPAVRAVDTNDVARQRPTPLAVTLWIGNQRIDLPVVEDGTRGFMQSGVLLLDVSAVADSPREFAIEISAPGGFPRPPRILRIEPGVVPIVQGGRVAREAHAGNGMPDQRIGLDVPGLRFGPDVEPLQVHVFEHDELRRWERVDDLTKCGPEDRVYELDTETETVVLGNGINGHLPEPESQILIDYPYCGGDGGNTPRNKRWSVRGVSGVFGTNPDAIAGGRGATSDADLRRVARGRAQEAHALVTAEDIKSAAESLAELEVARAHVAIDKSGLDGNREITLVVLRARAVDELLEQPEMRRWLAAVRRALLGRVPLGIRLRVRAPTYKTVAVKARVEALPKRSPEVIAAAVREKLRQHFLLVPRPGFTPRDFGASVTKRDMTALIRGVPGVGRLRRLEMFVDGEAQEEIKLPRFGLPRIDLSQSLIDVASAGMGGRA